MRPSCSARKLSIPLPLPSRRVGTLLAVLLLAAGMLPAAAVPIHAGPVAPGTAEFAPDTVLVSLQPGFDPQALLSAAGEGGAAAAVGGATGILAAEPVFPARRLAGEAPAAAAARLARIYRLRLRNGSDVAAAVKRLAGLAGIEYAEPDYLAHVLGAPSDALYGQQWGLAKIGAPAAWDVSTGAAATVIAVIDSGLDLTHEDLAGKLWTNPGETTGNGIDDDGDGLIDDVHGWNFADGSSDVGDTLGHGTQVAGVAAAASDNGVGIAGVCWGCRLLPVKVTRVDGTANYSDLARAIVYAAGEGAGVIDVSLGAYTDSATLKAAVEAAAQTATIVAAAGNDGRWEAAYPAAYPGVIGVGASNQYDDRTAFSNYGTGVDLLAPGVDIVTTFAGGGYGSAQGTSLAAAFVAGTAGLLRSQHADWSPVLVGQQIVNTAAETGAASASARRDVVEYRLDAAAALQTAPRARMAIESLAVNGDEGGQPAPGGAFQLTLTLANTWLPARGLVGTLSTVDDYATVNDATGSFGDIAAGETGDNRGDPFGITLPANTPRGRYMDFWLSLRGNEGYVYGLPLFLMVSDGTDDIQGDTTIGQDTTWTRDTAYALHGNVIVAAGVTLTIQAGTTVRADPGTWLRVDGTLIADGTAAAPVTFTGYDWSGLRFTDSSAAAEFDGGGNYLRGSLLRHVDVSQADEGVVLQSRAPYIAASNFHHNGTGLDAGSSAARIEGSLFTTNTVGIALGGGQPTVTGNTLRGNGEGIRGRGSPSIIGNELSGNTSAAIDMASSLGPAGAPTVRDNRAVGNGRGFTLAILPSAAVEHNLIESAGTDLWLDVVAGSAAGGGVRNNTLIGGGAYNLAIDGAAAGQMAFTGNNWLGGREYAVRLGAPGGVTVTLDGNYWGGLAAGQTPARVFDCDDTPLGCNSAGSTVGRAVVSSVLSDPDPTAPAFVSAAAVMPAPLGLERGTFDVTFSRPMSTTVAPALSFHDVRRGLTETLKFYLNPTAIERDRAGRLWFACYGDLPTSGCSGLVRYDGETWVTYTPANSGLPDVNILAVYGASNGDVWFAHASGALTRLRGTTWTTYTTQTTGGGLPATGHAMSLAEDAQGRIWGAWFYDGAVSYDGSTWRHYTTADGVPGAVIQGIARDRRGRIWFRYEFPASDSRYTGLVAYDGANWTTPADFPCQWVSALVGDSQGRVWVACPYAIGDAATKVAMYDGSAWTFFSVNNTWDVLTSVPGQFFEDPDGNVWADAGPYFDGVRWHGGASLGAVGVPARFDSRGNLWSAYRTELQVRWGGEVYPVVDDGQWLDATHYRATYTVSPLVPKGTYSVTVASATGLDGIAIAPDAGHTFIVDYLGSISDDTPPTRPAVRAAGDGSLSALDLHWSSQDSESGILQYRYALGTVVGGRDVVDWTYVTAGTTSAYLTGLSLAAGQKYYATVAARNARGLWSPFGVSNVVIGGSATRWLYLPVVQQP